eukprot:scaffold2912_cov67-Attheya_sp.AAC.3
MRNTTGITHNAKTSTGTATAHQVKVCHTAYYGLHNDSLLIGSLETKSFSTKTAVQPTYARHAMLKSRLRDTSYSATKAHNTGKLHELLCTVFNKHTQWTQTSGKCSSKD